MINSPSISTKGNERASSLFNFLLVANFLQYLEAGAVPAVLLSIATSFGMNSAQQGLLGGVVYLSLGAGGPFAGYLLRKFDHKTVIVCAVAANMIFTLLWAMTPIGHSYSSYMFIFMRFMMGLCQCIICVFLPLWTNENAPRKKRTTWMSCLQASVPCGIMIGYIIASICVYISQHADTCWGLLCWRWPFIIEMLLLCPLYMCLYFVSPKDLSVKLSQFTPKVKKSVSSSAVGNQVHHHSYGTMNPGTPNSTVNPMNGVEEYKASHTDEANQRLNASDPKYTTFTNLKTQAGKDSSAQRWMKLQSLEELEEKKKRASWRRTSMSVSMYDPLSTRDMIKRSYDDIALLDSSDLAGFRWAGTSQAPSPFDLEMGQSTPSHNLDKPLHMNENNSESYTIGDSAVETEDMKEDISKEPSILRVHPNRLKLLSVQKSPSFDSISLATKPPLHPDQLPEEENNDSSRSSESAESSVSSTVYKTAFTVHYEPLRYESLREVRRKSLSDDLTQQFAQPSTPTPAVKSTVSNLGTRRRAHSFECHNRTRSPITTIGQEQSSVTAYGSGIITEETSLLHSQNSSPEQNQVRDTKKPFSVWSWIKSKLPSLNKETSSSFGGDKSREGQDSLINSDRQIYNNSLHVEVRPDPDSDSQSGSDSEDEWMEYSPLKQRTPAYTFPDFHANTPSEIASGYTAPYNVNPSLSQRLWGNIWYYLRCCQRKQYPSSAPKRSWLKSVKALLSLPVYRNLLGAMSALYFTVTGVQYWGTKYLLISLHAPLLLVNVLFILCAATGPVLGVFFGGYIVDLFGGYKGYKKRVTALKIVCVLGLIGCVFSLPITLLDNIYLVIICLWLVLFFGGSILPACAGILVSIVPRHHRPTSASLSLMVFNMFGYCLSLILSGLLMQTLEMHSEMCDNVCAMTWGFRLILFWSYFSFIFLICAYFAARKYYQERELRKQTYEND